MRYVIAAVLWVALFATLSASSEVAPRPPEKPSMPVPKNPLLGAEQERILRRQLEQPTLISEKMQILERSIQVGAVEAESDYDIISYAKEVEEQLGSFPSFNVFEQGYVIPITVEGSTPASYRRNMKCDRPPLLRLRGDGQATPFSRIGRLPASRTGVDWVFIARRYRIRTNNDPLFMDLAVIGHNQKTGATAFFQAGLENLGPVDGRLVPSPMSGDPDRVKDYWLSPAETAGIYCNRCHDSDPWVHTPYVDQVTIEGAPIVPFGGEIRDGRLTPTPYRFVGIRHFASWPKPEFLDMPGNQCVACHRVGTLSSSGKFSLNAVGRDTEWQNTWVTSSFSRRASAHFAGLW